MDYKLLAPFAVQKKTVNSNMLCLHYKIKSYLEIGIGSFSVFDCLFQFPGKTTKLSYSTAICGTFHHIFPLSNKGFTN